MKLLENDLYVTLVWDKGFHRIAKANIFNHSHVCFLQVSFIFAVSKGGAEHTGFLMFEFTK